ncbi:MAG: aspartate-semialdehyde dehydrogenase [Bacteroidales bacterium]|nr:aspartate-semialdehyde dehydrogenase [Bacteroidales bacterium]
MKVAVVGATGLVGTVILQVLEEMKFPVSELIPVASEKSKGKQILFCKQPYVVVTPETAVALCPDIAIFSAGGETSRQWAKRFTEKGCFVIDNSSAWRMDNEVPLIIPEVNGHILKKEHLLISNPNCSTIQLLVAVAPLHKLFNIRKMIVSTYQSVTGTGVKAVQQLMNERKGEFCEKVYPHRIDLNCFPHGGDFLENNYTSEEMKLVHETHKILNTKQIDISATVVRIPVIGGHSESVYLEFEQNIHIETIRKALLESPGITLQEDNSNNIYPMPFYSEGKNDVFVGRLRKGLYSDNSLNMWIVADNLRKGAATNAVQIAQLLLENKYIQ